VKNFSLIAKLFSFLTESTCKFEWIELCDATFKELKGRLISSPILTFPKKDGQFILDTDASNFLKQDRKFGYLILKELKAGLPSYKVIGKGREVVKRLNDVVYCMRESNKHKNKVVHLDRLAPFYERT